MKKYEIELSHPNFITRTLLINGLWGGPLAFTSPLRFDTAEEATIVAISKRQDCAEIGMIEKGYSVDVVEACCD
jgi:hypothetical protein